MTQMDGFILIEQLDGLERMVLQYDIVGLIGMGERIENDS